MAPPVDLQQRLRGPFSDPLSSTPPQFKDLEMGDQSQVDRDSARESSTPSPSPTLPPLPQPQSTSSPLNFTTFPTSSDPLATQPLFTHSATGLRPNRKRGPPDATETLGQPSKTPRNDQSPQVASTDRTPRDAILEARDLIIEASTLTKSRDEQSRILDLLEVFREYTEKGRLRSAATIIASQVANLETATRKIEAKAKAPAPLQKSTPTTTATPPSFATIATTGARPSPSPQEWTTVGHKPKPPPKPVQPVKPASSRRLILVKSATGTHSTFSPLAVRNAFNKAFADKGVKGPVVTSVTKSLTQNIVVTTTSSYTADFLLEKRALWEHLVAFKTAQKDEAWHKVILHGIPIADFDNPEGMALVVEEIKTFNKGFTPIGTPYWLTSAEKRLDQYAGSVAVAFGTEAEATRAIRNRLYVAGISVRVEKLYSTAPSTQCTKCQGYGHLDTYCKKTPICRLCGNQHATQQHYCSVCKAKGAKCLHLVPKCANCKEPHAANTKSCEVLLAIKNKATTQLQC